MRPCLQNSHSKNGLEVWLKRYQCLLCKHKALSSKAPAPPKGKKNETELHFFRTSTYFTFRVVVY
jgi:hypothetical protein